MPRWRSAFLTSRPSTCSPLDLLVAAMGAEILEGDGVVQYREPDTGTMRTRASQVLGPYQRGETPLKDTPWEVAKRTGVPQASPVADLDPLLAEEATAHGHVWCWAWPVTLPEQEEQEEQEDSAAAGCLVLWRRLDEPPDHTCRASMARLVRLTALLFEREIAAGALMRSAVRNGGSRDLLDRRIDRRRRPGAVRREEFPQGWLAHRLAASRGLTHDRTRWGPSAPDCTGTRYGPGDSTRR